MSVLPLFSCAGTDDTDPTALPETYTYSHDDSLTDDLDLDAVSEALRDSLRTLRSVNGRPPLESYARMMDDADSLCPQYYEQDGNSFWYATCEASSGATYDGYSFFTLYEDVDLFGDGLSWEATVISGVADVTDAAGHPLHIGGYTYLAESLPQGESDPHRWYSAVAGAFYSEEPEAAESWLSEGIAPALGIYAARYEAYGINAMYITGAISLSGEVTALSTDALLIYDPLEGVYPCAEEPTGVLSFRDRAGRWFDVTFDIDPDTLTVDADQCDGCGTVTHNGDAIGSVCVDASVLLDWEEAPW